MNTAGTLSVGTVNLILWAAGQQGADVATLGRCVGLDPSVPPNPDERVPVAAVQQLWQEAIRATGNPYLDLQLGQLVHPTAVGTLAYVMLHSATLGQALEQLCRYQAVACGGVRTTLRQEPDCVWLSLELTSSAIVFPHHAFNSELSMYLAAFRLLTAQTLAPLEVRLAYPRPADTREHERVFAPARLVFDAAETTVAFAAAVLQLPVFNANPALLGLFEQHADALLARLHQPSLTARVKSEIVHLLKGAVPTLPLVADRLAMGVRTLQLHLQAAGLTYQQLLDEVRRELAERHLREPHLTTADIAFLLGYSEPSVFVRSFRKWTGQTPGAFRRQAV